ncbi:MAG: hypothetical protein EA394_11095 [Bacteroidia bacterium]|nr:MAG: hypothetical protein EA394_11095 [Bacteroidia bacterium]
MKRIYTSIIILSAMVLMVIQPSAMAQRNTIPDHLVGVDLHSLQKLYQKKVEMEPDSLLVPYADLLFFKGNLEESLQMYRKADSLELPMTSAQKRNFSHVAKRLGQTSPHDQETGYFSDGWQPLVRINEHCISSNSEDFAPFFWHDVLFITSSRADTKKRQRNQYAFTGNAFLNIYAFDTDCNRKGTDFLPPDLNTSLHDGPMAIAKDTSLVIITRNYNQPNEQSLQNLYLAYYVKENGQWGKEQVFPYSDPDYSLQHPYFDNENSILYFSSDRPGGYGGFDLYMSKWDGENWSEPENLGSEVNSEFDEVFPSLSPDGHLFFASNHIESMGGLSIVLFKDNTRFLLPEPFNTVYDDFAITFVDEASGYISSNRGLAAFNDNIFHFDMRPIPFVLRIVDSETQQPIAGLNVAFQTADPAIEGMTVTSGTGEVTLFEGYEQPMPIKLILTKEGYLPVEEEILAFNREDERWIVQLTPKLEPELSPPIRQAIEDGYFVLYFDNDYPDPNTWKSQTDENYEDLYREYIKNLPEFIEKSANSRQEVTALFNDIENGMEQLQWFMQHLLDELEDGKNIVLSFTSHTSPIATDRYNMLLSNRRFAAVKNFMTAWENGAILRFMDNGSLEYSHVAKGSSEAKPGISSDRDNEPESVYGVDASKERRVNIYWDVK